MSLLSPPFCPSGQGVWSCCVNPADRDNLDQQTQRGLPFVFLGVEVGNQWASGKRFEKYHFDACFD